MRGRVTAELDRKELVLPSIKLRFKNETIFKVVDSIVKSGNYPRVFYVLINKLVENPELFTASRIQTEEKISRTITELESITTILSAMYKEQDSMRYQLTESVKIMERLTSEILKMKEQNKIQQETLTETLEILSASNEGLEILRELKEKSQINLQEVINSTKVDETSFSEINEKVEEIKADGLRFIPPTSGVQIEGIDDEDDLLGSDFSQEEMLEIVRTFKSE